MAAVNGIARQDDVDYAALLTELISISRSLIGLLQSGDFDPEEIDRLTLLRSNLYSQLQGSMSSETQRRARPLAGRPEVAELLELEQHIRTLCGQHRTRIEACLQKARQQRQVAALYGTRLSDHADHVIDYRQV